MNQILCWKIGHRLPQLALLAMVALLAMPVNAAVERFKFSSGTQYLIIEFLDDDLVHFEISAAGPGPNTNVPIPTTPQVAKTDYAGPSSVNQSGSGGATMETPELRVTVNASSLCSTITDKLKGVTLTTLCPLNLAADWKGLTIQPGQMQHVYGLGEQFIKSGEPNGDWTGRERRPGDNYGNQMIGFAGGVVGNLQIPVMYAVGPNSANYALFLDHIYKQEWDIDENPWKVQTWGDQIRGYVMTGANLPDLRQDYMELTGHPPVPPKKMFGLWVSEYGYDDWHELESKLSALRADKFPVDGFVLDLQWFGGITSGSENSNMGRLTWDTAKFPNAKAKLEAYRNNEGIGIITIEESYIAAGRSEHADLASKGYLVRAGCPTCAPVKLTGNPWWGIGGMIDWTQDAAGAYWHDLKRMALINDGVIGHWIDLGEPEMYDPNDWVAGVLPNKHKQADYHNLYNFKWAESIARGYTSNNVQQRPFMMARSGAAGMQRFGATNWSGDIGGNFDSLAAHLNAQMHMAMSGIDYFGADIAGFHRGGDPESLFTRWYAHGMLLDVPGRPHTQNLCNCKQTAPSKIGNITSNLFNTRLRYSLAPYLYSLAHRAYLAGEPVQPPLVYYYQDDPGVRELSDEKLLGRDLLVATLPKDSDQTRSVYLPAGDWIDFYSNQTLSSTGQDFPDQTAVQDGTFRLPLYARAGALIPMMHVDDKTMNVLGKRTDGSKRDELIVRVYAAATPSRFTLYEDDGETIAYQSGQVRTTLLSQQRTDDTATVTVAAASGTYAGAPTTRNTVVQLVVAGAQAKKPVSLNGQELAERTSQADFDAAASGWFNAGNNLILAKSGPQGVAVPKTFAFTLGDDDGVTAKFECRNGVTEAGQAVYVVGNIPALGNWDSAKAVKLEPDGPYPTWTKTIKLLPNTTIEWKGIKRPESGGPPSQWEPGDNNVLRTPAAGSAGTTTCDFVPPPVSAQFVCDNGVTQPGTSVYVVGNIPALGNWDPAKAVKLDPTSYPRWTREISNLPSNTRIEWKGFKRLESGGPPSPWEPGDNNVLQTPASGSAGTTFCNFQ